MPRDESPSRSRRDRSRSRSRGRRRHSRSSSRDKDRDRDKGRGRGRDRSSSRDKGRRERDRDRSRSRSREREREREKEKDKERNREREREKDRDRDRSRDHKRKSKSRRSPSPDESTKAVASAAAASESEELAKRREKLRAWASQQQDVEAVAAPAPSSATSTMPPPLSPVQRARPAHASSNMVLLRGDHEQLVDDDEDEPEELELDPEAAAELKKKRDDARAMADAKAKVMAALTKDIDTSTDSHARGDRLKAWVAARAAKHTAEAVAKETRGCMAESSDFASESEAEVSTRRLNRDGGGLDTFEDYDDVPSAVVSTGSFGSTAASNGAQSSLSAAAPVEDEEDPLDAFMKGVHQEVQKVQAADAVVLGVATAAARLQPTLAPMIDQQESDDDKSSDDGKIDIYKLIERKTQCKNLNAIDHAAQNYPPFRRKFYTEVAEISNLTQEEVDKIREDNDTIQVNKSAPRPILEWWQAGLSERIESVIRKLQWAQPSPIQKQLLPVAMSGRDCVGVAKTGSGKTAAYLLPLFRHCMDQDRVVPGEGPIGIIFAPARELCIQIYHEAKHFMKHLNIHVSAIYGGAPISEQIAELKRGPDIVVCTPGRMIDMLAANAGRVTNLRRVTFVVIDEADRMFDLGFEPQIMRILGNVRPDRQMLLLSATFPKPVEQLARKALKRPVSVIIGGRSVVSDTIDHMVEIMPADAKFRRLLGLLGQWGDKGQMLVFVDRQENADELFVALREHGNNAMPLHGGLDQADRESTIRDYKAGVIDVLVCTSIAARGLDVPNLRLVVNFDCPNHYEDYVHRVGRTGRAGKEGTAYTFVTPDQEHFSPDLVKALEKSNRHVPQDLREMLAEFKKKIKEGGAKQQKGSGFGGRGFKFDTSEQVKHESMKKLQERMQKSEMGVSDSEDDAQQEALLKSSGLMPKSTEKEEDEDDSRVINLNLVTPGQQGVMVVVPAVAANAAMYPNSAVSAAVQAAANAAAAALAPNVAAALNAAKNRAAAIAGSGTATTAKPGATEVEKRPHFYDEIEINDLPQKARYRATHREFTADIEEEFGVAITVKGVFITGKAELPFGERKLYLAIESTEEFSVKKAKRALKKMLEEATLSAALGQQAITSRYKV